MDVYTWIGYILLGAILGTFGQGIRIIIGLKKQYDVATQSGKTFEEVFDHKKLFLSIMIALILGGISGVFWVIQSAGKEPLDRNTLFTIIAVGYAGTDFIEGFIQSKIPAIKIDKNISPSA